MEVEEINRILYEYVKKHGRVSRGNFPSKILDIPSYSTCKRKKVDLEKINQDALKDIYYENPVYCKNCSRLFEYKERDKKFCNSSCSAKFNNSQRILKNKKCLTCEVRLKGQQRKYCSNKCQIEDNYSRYIADWKIGKVSGFSGSTYQLSQHIRRYIRENFGTACSKCDWDERHPEDGSILTEVDHIDGDVGNTREDNLRVLCPNCHAMTPTFRARNKSSKRSRNR